MDVDLKEDVAEVGVADLDVGLPVKQCGMGIRKGHGRDTSGITQDQLILNGPWQRKESNV